MLQDPGSTDYKISFDYPVFSADHTAHAHELNALTMALVLETTAPYRGLGGDAANESEEFGPSTLSASFEVLLHSSDLVSVRFSIFHYGVGAAHPNHFTRTLNFQAGVGIPIDLTHVFSDISAGLSLLSRFSSETLGLEGSDWADGAAPRRENFERFNLHPDGMPITFGEYQVGPYAAGESIVVVPWSFLIGEIRPRSAIHRLASATMNPTLGE
jgi:hypothetical protein